MKIDAIIPLLKNLLNTTRILDTLAWYLLSLMIPSSKHSQTFAAEISGKNHSLFSDLLQKDSGFSLLTLNRASRRRLKKLMRKRKAIEKGAPWTIGIIIDATIHERSSRHLENAQIFNLGKGFVVGHKWTNIGLWVAGQYVPLPPISFYTREECEIRGIEYKTEHEKVVNFLRTYSLKSLDKNIDASEIVVLLDAGYDSKQIQNTIISRKWDFICSLKSDRNCSSEPMEWYRVDKYFEDGRRPWKTIRIASYCGRKKYLRQFQIKHREGYLKGVRLRVKLVCSKRSRDKKKKHLACSNLTVSTKMILLAYKYRWKIEVFHRDIKSFLGLEDAGVKYFNSLHNHVHWVYVAYNLLLEKFPDETVRGAQIKLTKELEIKEKKKALQIISRINGVAQLKSSFQSAIHKIELTNAA